MLSAGFTTEEAMRATQALATAGISITHLHASTLKPFAKQQFLDALSHIKSGIVTIHLRKFYNTNIMALAHA